MRRTYLLGVTLIIGFIINVCFAQGREIAITIDDLPFVGSANNNPAKLQREYDRFMQMLQVLIDNKVPATGFVIAGTIERGQWELLQKFQQAGFILGNHTYSHANLNTMSGEKYIANVDQADKILTPLMTGTKYFRYPYLAEGTGSKKKQVQNYLASRNYVIAPVTVDSKDFVFNKQFYAIPYRLRTQSLGQLKKRYLAYIWNQTLKAESRAKNRAKNSSSGKQILLIHANLLNSHCLADIIDLYRKNGYRFISLTDALKEPAPSAEPISEQLVSEDPNSKTHDG